MKINQIIREKRKELSLTQEQVAGYLGVSAPAVNKWEKGSAYPDITLLPALARLLKTDLNTLLSFHEDLTDAEITNFVNEVDRTAREQNYEAAFQTAMDKLHEYPACEKLAYSVMLYLYGALLLYGSSDTEYYKKIFEESFQRMSKSKDSKIRETAAGMLISRYLEKGDFSKATELIHTMPASAADKERQLATLYMQEEKFAEAEKIWEHKLLNSVAEIQGTLINMLEIALKEKRNEDADFYSDAYEQVSMLFHVAEWIPYNAKFLLSVARRDKDSCLSVLEKMLPAMSKVWRPEKSPFYRLMDSKETGILPNRMLSMIQNEIKNSEDFSFLRDCEEYKQLLKKF